ncbi:MAG: hypothetical protein GTO30_06005 [Acidobacteria bacterium]|nr:hypothetical protein [Acidobacteriota bacterium]NIO58744.1 hypothetical protein [Acidobacteriota bacterium]NIQ84518.1 hypothetical protein [Acidobacteriota bacterium]
MSRGRWAASTAALAAFADVSAEDADPSDTRFDDLSADPVPFFPVTGVGPNGESVKGHFGI